MSLELGRALLLSGAITPDALARALLATRTRDIAFEEALLSEGAIDERGLQVELGRWDGPTIHNVIPVPELVARLPRGMCRRLLAWPIRVDALTGTVDVAVADGRDPHAPAEIGRHLKAPVRAVRAPLGALRRALQGKPPVLAGLENARDRDSIVAIVLSAAGGVARRVAVLVARRDAIVGWSCSPEFGSASRLQELRMPSSVPNVFLAVAGSGTSYLGPVSRTPPHSALLEIAGTLTSDVAIAPVCVAGRCALLIVADELSDPALSTRALDEIARAAGDAIARILRRR